MTLGLSELEKIRKAVILFFGAFGSFFFFFFAFFCFFNGASSSLLSSSIGVGFAASYSALAFSYLTLSSFAFSSYGSFSSAVKVFHFSPSALPISGTVSSGFSSLSLGRHSSPKYMNEDLPRFGAFASFFFFVFAFFAGFSLTPDNSSAISSR